VSWLWLRGLGLRQINFHFLEREVEFWLIPSSAQAPPDRQPLAAPFFEAFAETGIGVRATKRGRAAGEGRRPLDHALLWIGERSLERFLPCLWRSSSRATASGSSPGRKNLGAPSGCPCASSRPIKLPEIVSSPRRFHRDRSVQDWDPLTCIRIASLARRRLWRRRGKRWRPVGWRLRMPSSRRVGEW
jgi:hypothetical protein